VSTVPERPAAYVRVEDAAFADDMTWRRDQDVFILGSAEAGRARAAEARQGEGDRLGIDA